MSSSLVGELTAIVANLTGDTRYFGKYAATVVKQHSNGTVDVRADSADIVFPNNLPIRYDAPGWSATVPQGARCNVAFSDGDPRKPYVCDFENGSITRLDYDGGTKNVARVDDTVNCGTLVLTAVGSVLTFTYTPPTGSTTVVAVTIAGAAVSVAGTGSIALTGKITSGNSKLRA